MKFWSLKKVNLIAQIFYYLIFSIKECSSEPALVKIEKSKYTVQVGSSVVITCNANYLRPIDVIWAIYPIGSPLTRTVIYSDRQYQGGFSSRYKISINEISFNNLTSSFEILSVQPNDAFFNYECECNVYRTCSNGNIAKASAGLVALTTTTKTTSQFASVITNVLESKELCLEGSYNTAQYVLVISTLIILIMSSLLFHYSCNGSLAETIFMILNMILSIVCLIISVIFWINPLLAYESSPSMIIICSGISGCVVLWVLILQYSIRLCLNDDLKLIICVLICLDGLFEAFCAGILIVANVYCSGLSSLPHFSDTYYTYLEILSASFLFIFALISFLIAGVIFYLKKKKNEEQNLKNFKSYFFYGTPNTICYPGFLPKNTNELRPTAIVQELWFPPKKIKPTEKNLNTNCTTTNNNNMIISHKPIKLAPIIRNEIKDYENKIGKLNKNNLIPESSNLENENLKVKKKLNKKKSNDKNEKESKLIRKIKNQEPCQENSGFENIFELTNIIPQLESNNVAQNNTNITTSDQIETLKNSNYDSKPINKNIILNETTISANETILTATTSATAVRTEESKLEIPPTILLECSDFNLIKKTSFENETIVNIEDLKESAEFKK